jgi:hypothetical protein
VGDIKEMKLNLDQFQSRQASKSLEDANEALRRMIRETYKWIVAPMQEARPGKGLSEIQWEHFQVNPGAQNLSQEIERVLKENELLITEWAPIHLATVLKTGSGRTTSRTPAPQRVAAELPAALSAPLEGRHGLSAHDGRGRREPRLLRLRAGQGGWSLRRLHLRQAHIAIPRLVAAADRAGHRCRIRRGATCGRRSLRAKPTDPRGASHRRRRRHRRGSRTRPSRPTRQAVVQAPQAVKKQFYGSIELDAIQAKKQFADLVDEVVLQFTIAPRREGQDRHRDSGRIGTGFDDGLQRAVKENCNVLRFKNAEFEFLCHSG